MNFKYKLDGIEEEIKKCVNELKATRAELKECIAFTGKFLAICKELGVKKVAIGVSRPSVKSSTSFGFGPSSSAFADEETRDEYSRPAIWEAVERAGISGGCGNSGQHQINGIGLAKLIDGCYHLNKGQWKKVD